MQKLSRVNHGLVLYGIRVAARGLDLTAANFTVKLPRPCNTKAVLPESHAWTHVDVASSNYVVFKGPASL
jgi:hypothetical protein